MAQEGLLARLSPGHHDDGSAAGIVLVKSLGSGLVRLPLRMDELVTAVSTAGTCGATNAVGNSDGTGLGISMAAPQVVGTTTSSATVETTVWGPRVGVRITRATTTAAFTLIVDGVPYKVDATRNRRYAAGTFTVSDTESMFVVADDLTSGPHNVVAALVGQPANGDGTSRSVGLLGWVADSAFYPARPRAAVTASTPQAVPTSATIIPTVTHVGLISSIDFYNTTAGAITATLTKGGTAYWSMSVPATTGVIAKTFDPPIQSVASVQAERWLASGSGLVARINEAS
jgi:hypothetical protein